MGRYKTIVHTWYEHRMPSGAWDAAKHDEDTFAWTQEDFEIASSNLASKAYVDHFKAHAELRNTEWGRLLSRWAGVCQPEDRLLVFEFKFVGA